MEGFLFLVGMALILWVLNDCPGLNLSCNICRCNKCDRGVSVKKK